MVNVNSVHLQNNMFTDSFLNSNIIAVQATRQCVIVISDVNIDE